MNHPVVPFCDKRSMTNPVLERSQVEGSSSSNSFSGHRFEADGSVEKISIWKANEQSQQAFEEGKRVLVTYPTSARRPVLEFRGAKPHRYRFGDMQQRTLMIKYEI